MKNNLTTIKDNRSIIRSKPRIDILGVIGDFNNIFSFINNLSTIFSSGGNKNETLDQILNNQALLQEIQKQLTGMDGKLSGIIAGNEISEELLQELLGLSGNQTVMLTNIENKLDNIQNTLNIYFPNIMHQLSQISKQNKLIANQLDVTLQAVYYISHQLEEINTNVILNSVITEFIPSFQRIKYVAERFDTLIERLNPEEKITLLTKNISKEETEIIFNNEMVEIREFAESLVSSNIDDLLFYLTTFGDVSSGNTLMGRSGIEVIGEFLITNKGYGTTQESELVSAYKFVASLLLLQVRAYGALLSCRDILGYPNYDFSSELKESATKQIRTFTDNQINKYDSLLSTTYIKHGLQIKSIDNSKGKDVVFKADPGYTIVGLEWIEENDGSIGFGIYQAKVKENYTIDLETLYMYKIDNYSDKLFMASNNAEYYTIRPSYVSTIILPNDYIMTGLEFRSRGLVDVTVVGNKYNSKTGEIDENDEIRIDSADSFISSEELLEKTGLPGRDTSGAHPIGLLMDSMLAPLKGFGIATYGASVSGNSVSTINYIADSYLKEQILATSINNLEKI